MQRTNVIDIKDLAGQTVELYGWVHNRRDHGKLIFIDIRDRSGIAQVVFTPGNKEIHEQASQLRAEWTIHVTGKINARPEKMVNSDIPTGRVEIEPVALEILNTSETPPFPIDTDGREIGEEHRMKYRYLDLRRARMTKNLIFRHRIVKFIRDYLDAKGFLEIETPVLTKSTPEGARDYVVPSRLYPGKFFALPQSPQQYKQLLMVGGVEKYFQIARCFRDEDTRGDRQPEFTQLDLEMSFVEQEDVMRLNENLLIELVKKLAPEKRIQQIPFPQISYKEAMEKYGTDRPDIRTDKNDPNLLAFCWVVDFPFFEKTDAGGWTFTHNPFSAAKPEFRDDLLQGRNVGDILTTQYDIVLNGSEVGGGSIRNHTASGLRAVFTIMGFDEARVERNFGHMLQAFSFGAPPHGGIAWGLDRLLTILGDEPNIREVIAFPKTGDARDLMMESPSDLEEKQLKELHIKITS
ncbi:MAG TPA: aspartate--tRNA ligase [Candidatus Paceibacterota bacterium]|nr:aspartate--tRNA ligase [Candidatus Paceibacterota bacterium]